MTEGSTLTNQQINSIIVDESRHSPDYRLFSMKLGPGGFVGVRY